MTSSDSVLGEKLFDGKSRELLDWKRPSIYRNGIADGALQILWDDVAQIYLGGTAYSLNGIPSGEDRELRIVDSHGAEITFTAAAFFRMGQQGKDQFGNAYAFVLDNVARRQWDKFLQTIQTGQHYSFWFFEVAKDGFYFPKLVFTWKGMKNQVERIDTAQIKASSIKQGVFYIRHQIIGEKLKLKNKRVGKVNRIPNIHIVQSYINLLNQIKPRI